MRSDRRLPALALAAVLGMWCALSPAADWPTWRHDANRSCASPAELPRDLRLQWTRDYPPLDPAWPDDPKVAFDVAYEPIVLGKSMFVASSANDSLTALDTETGDEKWRFYADGPVRFAPVAWQGRVYFVSDDGYLYGLAAADGKLLWRFRGGPSERKVLGNGRLINLWPARGGPVLVEEADGNGHPQATIYFTAGIWPVEGVFLHALDAETGKTVWTNDGSGSAYILQPHDSPAFSGVAPQGYLAAIGNKLLVPNGRAVPACFHRHTGKLLYYPLAANHWRGSASVSAMGDFFFNSGAIFDLPTGKFLAEVGHEPVLTPDAMYATKNSGIQPYDLRRAHLVPMLDTWDRPRKDAQGKALTRLELRRGKEFARGGEADLLAGRRLFVGEQDLVRAFDPAPGAPEAEGTRPEGRGRKDESPLAPRPSGLRPSAPSPAWETKIDGMPWSMLAADNRLFVVTLEGRIYCFGQGGHEPQHHPPREPLPPAAAGDEWAKTAREVIQRTQITDGYCLVLGLGTGRLTEELARQSKLQIIAVDPDPATVAALRARLDAEGIYGTRVAAHVGDPLTFPFPPYLASLIVSEDSSLILQRPGGDEGRGARGGSEIENGKLPTINSQLPPRPRFSAPETIRKLFETLRPYGGVACLAIPPARQESFAQQVSGLELRYAQVKRDGDFVLLTRVGALPGSADWTHQYADAANTLVSRDTRVKAPLGLLWFGGSSNAGSLPRHGHGPSEQVVGGRLIIEGTDRLRALDVYTGRVLWDAMLPKLGRPYDNTSHQPGANAIGSNFVSVRDGIYVAHGRKCLRLDPATGKTLAAFEFPAAGGKAPAWGYLAVWADLLIAGASPAKVEADVEFSIEEFGGPRAKVDHLIAWIRRWKDFQPVPRARGDAPVDFVVSNLNKLLADQDLLARLPPKETKRTYEVEAIQKLIEWHLQTRDESRSQDIDLKRLNRRLIEKCYPTLPHKPSAPGAPFAYSGTSSQYLVGIDRYTGKLLWTREAASGFLHNAIAVGGGRIYCTDRPPEGQILALKRRGKTAPAPSVLLAIDARWGKPLWSTSQDVFGTWLAYSEDHDILLQAARPSRDMLPEPLKRMSAHRGRDGKVLWDIPDKYEGPPMLHGDTIIAQGKAFSLLTGAEQTRPHPLTGVPIPWRFTRNYGCGTAIASEYLLTFRSAAAGFYDLTTDGGTGNLGGFRSGCTSNLIAADGVLSAPEYTRTCTCAYPNQTSLAFVHRPDVEMWTFNAIKTGPEPIRRIGINLGAPGDRMADNGTLWLDYPSLGGPSPDPPLRVTPDKPEWFCHHSSWIVEGERVERRALEQEQAKSSPTAHSTLHAPPSTALAAAPSTLHAPPSTLAAAARSHALTLPWVAASGAKGLRSLTLTLSGPGRWMPTPADGHGRWLLGLIPNIPVVRAYTVRLHFVEPGDAAPGERIFDVAIQGQRVLRDLDIARDAGGPRRALVREFRGIQVGADLVITLTPARSAPNQQPVLCGIEAVAEGW